MSKPKPEPTNENCTLHPQLAPSPTFVPNFFISPISTFLRCHFLLKIRNFFGALETIFLGKNFRLEIVWTYVLCFVWHIIIWPTYPLWMCGGFSLFSARNHHRAYFFSLFRIGSTAFRRPLQREIFFIFPSNLFLFHSSTIRVTNERMELQSWGWRGKTFRFFASSYSKSTLELARSLFKLSKSCILIQKRKWNRKKRLLCNGTLGKAQLEKTASFFPEQKSTQRKREEATSSVKRGRSRPLIITRHRERRRKGKRKRKEKRGTNFLPPPSSADGSGERKEERRW